MKKDKFKINLQLFNDQADTQTDKNEGEESKEEIKTFTQEELDEIIAKRLVREKAKFETEFKTKIETERQEAEELAKLSEKERQKVIFDKQLQEFETERKKFQREKIELEVTKQLAAKNLPIEFANLLVDETADISFENIANFEHKWQEALSKAVDEKIKGTSPRGSSTQLGVTANANDFLTIANEASIRK